MATAKKKPARKKTAARKKAAPKKKAASKAAPKSEVPVKAAPAEQSLEARILAPLTEMEQMIDRLRQGWLRPMAMGLPRLSEMPSLFEARFPSIDVVDRDKEIVVKAEVPGIDKDDINVSVTNRTLTIKGESRHEEEKEEGDMHRREIRSGSFSRTVTLPADVDGRKAKASYKDGMVELHLPKLRGAKKHSIELD